MKQNTKSKTALTGAILLGLTAGLGMAGGNFNWAIAGILGLAALGFCGTFSQPKPAVVRVRSQRKRS